MTNPPLSALQAAREALLQCREWLPSLAESKHNLIDAALALLDAQQDAQEPVLYLLVDANGRPAEHPDGALWTSREPGSGYASQYAEGCRDVPLYAALTAASERAGCAYPDCSCDGPAEDGGCADPKVRTAAVSPTEGGKTNHG